MARRKRERTTRPSATPHGGDAKDALPAPEASAVETPLDRWRPWVLALLAALFVARPLFPSESVADQGDGLPVVMLWLALAIFWLLGAIGRHRSPFYLGWTDAAVAALIGLHTLAALWAAWDHAPRPAVNMLWEWIGFGLSYFLARQVVRGPREVRAMLVVMVALAVSLAGHGLYQYFYELPATRAAYYQDPDRALQEAGLWYEPGSRQREQFEKRLASVEPLATFALTNSLAGFLAPWLAIAVGIGLGSIVSRGGKLRTWLAVVACGAPIALCLLLTKSRSAFVATLFGMGLLALLRIGQEASVALRSAKERGFRGAKGDTIPSRRWISWRWLAAAGIAGSVLLAAALVIGGLDRQVWSEAAKSLGYRLEYWQATLKMIGDDPWMGCGPGHFQNAYTRYKLPQASEEIADPHNFFLEIWATAGTPAALALLAVLGTFFGTVWRSARVSRPRRDEEDCPRCVLCGAAAGFLLSVPLGLMGAASPGLTPVLVGLPLAVAAMLLFGPWIESGTLPRSLPAVGVVVLLVNLLAAGGMGLPGVAGSLWLLLALGLTAVEDRQPRFVSQRGAAAVLALTAILVCACYTSAYAPVMKHLEAIRAFQRDPLRAEQHLREAAAADPLGAEAWKQLANLAFQRWLDHPTPESMKSFEESVHEALARDPNASTAWLHYADCYQKAFHRTAQRDYLERSITMYRRAIELYPNHAVNRAKLAEAYRLAGRWKEFRREATVALDLDALTPHEDKKLPEELRQSLRRSSEQGK